MHGVTHNEGIGLKGEVIVRAYRAGTKELLREIRTPNVIVVGPSRGKDLIVQRLIGTNTYSLNITHGELGTGSSAPAATDTQLESPVARAGVGYAADNALTTAVLHFFFPDASLPNGTYREFGSFVDGNSSLNSGRMFNHALLSDPYEKVSGVDTTVELNVTVS
jgi:hypothetical protein